MKTVELIKWATEKLKTEKDKNRETYLKQIITRGNLIVASTQKCEGYTKDIEEYIGQLAKRGLTYDLDLPEGEPQSAEGKEILRAGGVSGGGGKAGQMA